MGKGVEGRREMDLVPHSKLGGGGKGRLLPKGPWLMVLIPNSIWGLVQPLGEWRLLGTVKEKCTASTTGRPSILSSCLSVAHPFLNSF